MAICDYIEYRMNRGELISKFEHEDFRNGSRLVVYPSQTAVFVRGGVIHKVFNEGTYTLTTKHFPFISKLVGKAVFGKSTALFRCQVYFVNKSALNDVEWGISSFDCTDGRFKVSIGIKARGSFIARITDVEKAFTELCGTNASFSTENLKKLFSDQIASLIPQYIKCFFDKMHISIFDIERNRDAANLAIQLRLNDLFAKYGISTELFSIVTELNESDREELRGWERKYADADYLAYLKTQQGYLREEKELDLALAAGKKLIDSYSDMSRNFAGNPFGAALYCAISGQLDNVYSAHGIPAAPVCPPPMPFVPTVRVGIVTCPNCVATCPAGTNYCPVCGTKL